MLFLSLVGPGRCERMSERHERSERGERIAMAILCVAVVGMGTIGTWLIVKGIQWKQTPTIETRIPPTIETGMTVFEKVVMDGDTQELTRDILRQHKTCWRMGGIFRRIDCKEEKWWEMFGGGIDAIWEPNGGRKYWEGFEIEQVWIDWGESNAYIRPRNVVYGTSNVAFLYKFMRGYILQILKNVKSGNKAVEGNEKINILFGRDMEDRMKVFVIMGDMSKVFRGLKAGWASYVMREAFCDFQLTVRESIPERDGFVPTKVLKITLDDV